MNDETTQSGIRVVKPTTVTSSLPVTLSQDTVNNDVASAALMECTEEEADRKWKEAFANTTEEEFDRLEKMFLEEEEKYGTMPLDFTGK